MNAKIDLLTRVAELYYEQDLSQNDIAKMLDTSRPTVSRLLVEAKREGIVEITVHSPIRKHARLSLELRRALSLREAIVVSGRYDYEKALRRCCEATLSLCNTILENNATIGIAWGAAPRYLCDLMEEHPYDQPYYNVNVVQMVGCLGTGNPNIDGIELALRMSRSLGGRYSNIYAPIYVGSEEVYHYLIQEPQIESTLKHAEHLDIILTGVGSLDEETILQRAGYFTDADRRALLDQGAVGHLLARPFDRTGAEIVTPGRYTVGAPLSAMRSAEWSIGISAAEFKAEATLAAVRGGYINVLVVDEVLATRLLELA